MFDIDIILVRKMAVKRQETNRAVKRQKAGACSQKTGKFRQRVNNASSLQVSTDVLRCTKVQKLVYKQYTKVAPPFFQSVDL